MGFVFRKSVGLGRGRRMNISRRGVSVSERVGPLNVNSRGRASIRIIPGLSFRFKI